MTALISCKISFLSYFLEMRFVNQSIVNLITFFRKKKNSLRSCKIITKIDHVLKENDFSFF